MQHDFTKCSFEWIEKNRCSHLQKKMKWLNMQSHWSVSGSAFYLVKFAFNTIFPLIKKYNREYEYSKVSFTIGITHKNTRYIRIHEERTVNRKCKKVDCIMNRIPYVKLQIDINYRNVLGVVYRLLNGWKNGCDVFSFKSDDRLDNRFSWIHRKSSRKIFTKMLYSSFVCFLVRICVAFLHA